MDKGDLFRRNALCHQLLFDVIVHIKGAVPVGRGEVTENKLGTFLGFRIPPDFQHIPHTGIDFAFRVVGQFGICQTLIQRQLPAVRRNLEHIVLPGFH